MTSPGCGLDFVDHFDAKTAMLKRAQPLDAHMSRRRMLPAVIVAAGIAVVVRIDDEDAGRASGFGDALKVFDGVGRLGGALGQRIELAARLEEFVQRVDQQQCGFAGREG